MSQPPLGFIPEPITLALDRILPSRKPPEGLHASRKFKQIVVSMEAVGMIEPLSVGKVDKKTGQHILLDGHMRLLALRQIGYTDALCLIATDDESYTYNNRINRISSIQEHQMLRHAVERGVTAERLAKALNVDVSLIHKKVSLLDGICSEAIEMLKDQHFSVGLGSVLRRMKPTRQVECVELMLTANNMTVAYAEALFAATPPHLVVGEKRLTTLPSRSTRNFVKFHLMRENPRKPDFSFLRKAHSGWVPLPLTSILAEMEKLTP